jgi:hypothetical protein
LQGANFFLSRENRSLPVLYRRSQDTLRLMVAVTSMKFGVIDPRSAVCASIFNLKSFKI